MLLKSRNVRSRQFPNQWLAGGRYVFLVATFVAVFANRGVMAQEKCSDPSLDNLKHPPNTATSPLGELGPVDKVGTGPVPMILIPGAAFGGSIWKDFMERNRDAYTMYAITPPGYEGTKPPPWPEKNDFSDRVWTDALCKAIVKLIDDKKLDRPILVGHHMLGDHYAMRIALDHPEKVRGVVVIAGMPSMAFGARGQNEPGKPVKTATLEQRRQMVQSFFAPFYKTVTEKMWQAGSYQARMLCRDATRAAQLFDQQVSVPIPTQLGYFFEYETTDLELDLGKLAVPLLVVLPRREWNLDVALDNYREANEMMYGNLDRAKAAWTSNLSMQWGDVNEGTKWMYDWGFRWERLRGVVPKMTVRYIDNTGIFIMEDQPKALDQELRSFIAGL
jgi:pimeloyl-ACP methyl ester carboxylesterase